MAPFCVTTLVRGRRETSTNVPVLCGPCFVLETRTSRISSTSPAMTWYIMLKLCLCSDKKLAVEGSVVHLHSVCHQHYHFVISVHQLNLRIIVVHGSKETFLQALQPVCHTRALQLWTAVYLPTSSPCTAVDDSMELYLPPSAAGDELSSRSLDRCASSCMSDLLPQSVLVALGGP